MGDSVWLTISSGIRRHHWPLIWIGQIQNNTAVKALAELVLFHDQQSDVVVCGSVLCKF